MRNFRLIFVPVHRRNIYVSRVHFKTFKNRILNEVGEHIKDKKPNVHGTFSIFEKGGIDIGVIWLKPGCSRAEIIHECFHAVCWIRGSSGDWLTNSSEESYAYLLQWLCQEVGL